MADDDYVMGDLADLYPDEEKMQPPVNAPGGMTPEDWMMSGQQPPAATYDPIYPRSWLDKATELSQKDAATYQAGGPSALMASLAGDSQDAQELAGGFGGVTKGVRGPPLKGFAPGSIAEAPPVAQLGDFPTTTPRAIYGGTMQGGGYSVNLPTGQIPTEGLMVGKYANTDPRNMIVPVDDFKQAAIRQHAATNAAALNNPSNYLGTWKSPEGQVYLDVSQRFDPDKIRVATKYGERTNQISGYNVAGKDTFPIGNWRNFVASPEFRGRMDEMAGVGRDYLNNFPSKEWWDMHGSSFERAYGTENLPQVAGFSAATAPVSNPYDNMRAMSEYMRRHISGEPTIQPDFRIPEGGMGPWSAGKQIPLEQSRIANLNKAAAGNLDQLQRAKVREEAMAMSGDPNAVVLDRHWARITEDPSRGIFANAQEGVINTGTPKKGVGDYDYVKGHVSDAAQAAGRDPRDYSADVWTGIRETIKNTSQLFGTKYRGSAITGESKSYADIFQELLQKKADHLGISTDELDKRLRSGSANLLSTMLAASPTLWGAYKQWQSSQVPMGGLAAQDQYD